VDGTPSTGFILFWHQLVKRSVASQRFRFGGLAQCAGQSYLKDCTKDGTVRSELTYTIAILRKIINFHNTFANTLAKLGLGVPIGSAKLQLGP